MSTTIYGLYIEKQQKKIQTQTKTIAPAKWYILNTS
jgi:hypothetical protein